MTEYQKQKNSKQPESAGLGKEEPVRKEHDPVKNKKPLARKKTLVAYSFILPNLIGFFIFTLIPIVFSLLLSFCEWDSGNPIRFVGLKNFITMFTKDSSFWIALKNTLCYTLVTVHVTMVLLGIIMMVTLIQFKGEKKFTSYL